MNNSTQFLYKLIFLSVLLSVSALSSVNTPLGYSCSLSFMFSTCFFTARKRSLRRLCFYTCLTCLSFRPQGRRGGGIQACIAGGIPAYLAAGLWGGVVSQHALQVVSQHALQQVSKGGTPSMPCRFPGLHPRGKLRGIWLGGGLQAHTQGGPVEGDLVQAHSQGGVEGDLVQAHTQGGS